MLLGLYPISSRIKPSSLDGRRTSFLGALLVGGDGRGCFDSPSLLLASRASARRTLLRRDRRGRFSTP